MSETPGKKKALGRGLGALLENDTEKPGLTIESDYSSGSFRFIRISQIETNPFQPRTVFHETELNELADSIRQHGIVQPITIRKTGADRYQLISGERRLRASSLAGLTEIPAFIRLADDEQMLEIALVENIQREDLNPIEIALSYQRLLDECHLTQETLSQKVGKDRTTISNYIRLLKLPGEIQIAIRDNLITMGHARALIGIQDEKAQLILLKSILERKASVRQVEEMVRSFTTQKQKTRNHDQQPVPPRMENARLTLLSKLQSGVDLVVNKKGQGKIIISFKSEADFERIMAKIES
jgi:ParB family chromosome partitioning protein